MHENRCKHLLTFVSVRTHAIWCP